MDESFTVRSIITL